MPAPGHRPITTRSPLGHRLAKGHGVTALQAVFLLRVGNEALKKLQHCVAGATLKHSPHAILDSLPSPFGHGAGVRCRRGVWVAAQGDATMIIGILNELLLFSCLAALVTGIVIAAASVLI
jgi:hypothetical protein